MTVSYFYCGAEGGTFACATYPQNSPQDYFLAKWQARRKRLAPNSSPFPLYIEHKNDTKRYRFNFIRVSRKRFAKQRFFGKKEKQTYSRCFLEKRKSKTIMSCFDVVHLVKTRLNSPTHQE